MTVAASSLTLADAARMLRDALRGDGYQATPIGREVEAYLGYLRMERGSTPDTLSSVKYVLADLAVWLSDKTIADLEPPQGTELIREFWYARWGDAAVSTRKVRLAILRGFGNWLYMTDRIQQDPTRKISYPRGQGRRRNAHRRDEVLAIVAAQELRRDRIAIELMGRMGFRRNEIRICKLSHFDLAHRTVVVFGKGGTVNELPLYGAIAEDVEREIRDRAAVSSRVGEQHLLYPYKLGKRGRYPLTVMDVVWEDRFRPLSVSGVNSWWLRCLERAGVSRFPMHELRHSAGSDFYRQTKNLLLTQQMLRHQQASTTANVYLHLMQEDLAEAMRRIERGTRGEGER